MKRTFQPSNRRRARKQGFRATSAKVLNARRRKGRKRLAPTIPVKGNKKG